MSDDLTTDMLAKLVQNHIPVQPYRQAPDALTVYYNSRWAEPWTVRFVVGLNGTMTRRVWATVAGATLHQALAAARLRQTGG